jgi:hypothetical protein
MGLALHPRGAEWALCPSSIEAFKDLLLPLEQRAEGLALAEPCHIAPFHLPAEASADRLEVSDHLILQAIPRVDLSVHIL